MPGGYSCSTQALNLSGNGLLRFEGIQPADDPCVSAADKGAVGLLDPRRLDGGTPDAAAEVVKVDPFAALVREQAVFVPRTFTIRSSRNTSARSSAIHSCGRSPVAAAKATIGPKTSP
jgi:hypothetical protein